MLALALAGCTGETPPPPSASSSPVNAPALPADQLPPLADRANEADISVQELVSDGSTLVMVAGVDGRRSLPLFRWSNDAGATWADGQLTDDAARTTALDDLTIGVAAVASAGEQRTWLALGKTTDGVIAWTSADARAWNRTPVVGLDKDADNIESVTGLTGGGFVAVGYAYTTGEAKPRIWNSPDGITWARAKVPVSVGTLSEVAARGDQLVVVGSHYLKTRRKGREAESLLLTSKNRGVTWASVRVREPADSGEFVSHLGEVAATRSGFVVGGSYYDDDERTYRPLLLRSTGVGGWKLPSDVPEYDESSGVDELLTIGASVLVVLGSNTSESVDKLSAYYLHSDRTWHEANTPINDQSVWEEAGAVALDVAVVGVQVDTHPATTTLWRFTDPSTVDETPVVPPAGAGAPLLPGGLMMADGAVSAYGTTQGADVWWPGGSSGFQTPKVILDKEGDSVEHVAWSKDGGFLATGRHADQFAFTMSSADGAAWRRTKTSTFIAEDQYHYSTINDVAWAHNRWVVVGEKSTNGDVRTSALVYTAPDGRAWTQGKPTTVTARGDWYGRNSPLDDLHGLDEKGRTMNDVIGMRTGLLAVGDRRSAEHQRPTAWLAGNNRTWRMIRLNSPGYVSAGVWKAVRVGDVVIAGGWAKAANAKRDVRAIWRSGDGGRTWSFQAFKNDEAGWLAAATDHDFVMIVRSDDLHTLTMYRSPDGITWTGQPLAVDGWSDGVLVGLEDALVDGDRLYLMLTVANRLTASTVVQTVQL